jgi:branched-chain amino acid transport system substrate-binding protein
VKVLTGDELRWGFENLKITKARIKEAGYEGFMGPINNSCEDHEGGKAVLFQQWDGQKWVGVGQETPMYDFVRERVEASAAKYAKEKGITPKDCQ